MTQETFEKAKKLHDIIGMIDNSIPTLSHPNISGTVISIHSALKKEYLEFTKQLREKYQKELNEL